MRVEYINPFVEAAFNVLREVLQSDVKRGELYLKSTSMPVMGVAAIVGLAGDVEGRVGGQMVKGEMYVLGKIKFMMPGYKKIDTVEKEIDGVKATFDHYIGDLGERHGKSKGQIVYANLYLKAAA